MQQKSHFWLLMSVFAVSAQVSSGAVERYRVESEFDARLTELGITDRVIEGFESSDWDHVRSPTILEFNFAADVISQGVIWSAAAKDVFGDTFSNRPHGITTNLNWARTGTWGMYEFHSGESYPTTIRVSSDRTIYGVGGWFNTNPDGQSVGFLFEDRTSANAPGYVIPGYGAMYPSDNPSVEHVFSGIIDPDGFNSVVITGTLEINEKGILEGGIIYGADDFTVAVSASLLCLGDCDASGSVDFNDLVSMLFEFGNNTGDACDADESGSVDFNDLVAALFVFGPCT